MSTSRTTTDHKEIKQWAESRGGRPARVEGTDILRIDFPGYGGDEQLEEISWELFFEKFDEHELQFLYQEESAEGKESRFNKFISQNNTSSNH